MRIDSVLQPSVGVPMPSQPLSLPSVLTTLSLLLLSAPLSFHDAPGTDDATAAALYMLDTVPLLGAYLLFGYDGLVQVGPRWTPPHQGTSSQY